MTQYVYGKNVIKQLMKDQKHVYEVIKVTNFQDREFDALLKQSKIMVKEMSRKQMDAMFQGDVHQGIAAKIDDYKTYDIEDVVASIPEGKTPLLIMLDGLEDPHNLGAILRTADAVGVDGIILPKNRSVRLTPTVAKVSTGAIDTVKVSIVTNLSQTLKSLKEKGFWVAGADLEKSVDFRRGDYTSPLVLVIGSEGFGISPLVKKQCDFIVRLPMEGTITSLNASVACGILLYQIYQQRNPL